MKEGKNLLLGQVHITNTAVIIAVPETMSRRSLVSISMFITLFII